VKVFILFLVRMSRGLVGERIATTTLRHYVSHTLAAAFRCTQVKQLDDTDRLQMAVYIKTLEAEGELSEGL
jgi:hypothetical protein